MALTKKQKEIKRQKEKAQSTWTIGLRIDRRPLKERQ